MIPILVYEGVSGAEAFLALAALKAGGVDAEFVSSDALVLTQEGARIIPARTRLDTLGDADAAVVPGGDTRALLTDANTARTLRARRGKWTLASGNAIHLVARVGLTDGRKTARAPDGAPIHGAAETTGARIAADGRLATCSGGDAIADLVLHYVAHVHDADAARTAAETLGRMWAPFVMGATDGA